MVVRDIYGKDINTLIELFKRLLIKYNIPYLYLDNELHFDKYVLRFHEENFRKGNITDIVNNIITRKKCLRPNKKGYFKI